MSNRELAKELIDQIPEGKMIYVLSFLQGAAVPDEEEDDAFCLQMYQNYLNDPEKGDFVSLEEACREAGVSLDEL